MFTLKLEQIDNHQLFLLIKHENTKRIYPQKPNHQYPVGTSFLIIRGELKYRCDL